MAKKSKQASHGKAGQDRTAQDIAMQAPTLDHPSRLFSHSSTMRMIPRGSRVITWIVVSLDLVYLREGFSVRWAYEHLLVPLEN